MEGSHPIDHGEEPLPTTDQRKQGGGWITFPFILATTAGITLANGGWGINLIVYLISVYKVKNIDAAQISNLLTGCGSLIPVLAAIIADSFFGCFTVIWISCFISIMGVVLLFVTTMFNSSSSQSCEIGSPSLCASATPSKFQFVLLYAGIALATIGSGGMRSTISTMGANQFNKPKNQSIFFNWFFLTWYMSLLISSTAIVYVEDNVSWSWGFGLSVGANVLGLAIFLFGIRFYRRVKPEGSPFMGIARVFVATIRKRKVPVSTEKEDYYNGVDTVEKLISTPRKSFRFLNRAALRREGDTNADGSIAKPWNLCTIQQVEDLKTIIRIMPLWSTSICLVTPSGIQLSLTILQALTMDRRIGPHFKFPAGSILLFVLLSTALCLTIFDRLILPTCQYLIGRPLTPLQRIGIGHVLTVISMAISAIVESKRLGVAHSKPLLEGSIAPISVMWLVPQLVIVGIGEAFHYPGQVALYYQEFPKPLKNLGTAMIQLLVAIAFYLSTALIDLVRRVTGWLPDDLNDGRLDKVYWVVVVIGVLNFGYYLTCAWLYKYRNEENMVLDEANSRSTE